MSSTTSPSVTSGPIPKTKGRKRVDSFLQPTFGPATQGCVRQAPDRNPKNDTQASNLNTTTTTLNLKLNSTNSTSYEEQARSLRQILSRRLSFKGKPVNFKMIQQQYQTDEQQSQNKIQQTLKKQNTVVLKSKRKNSITIANIMSSIGLSSHKNHNSNTVTAAAAADSDDQEIQPQQQDQENQSQKNDLNPNTNSKPQPNGYGKTYIKQKDLQQQQYKYIKKTRSETAFGRLDAHVNDDDSDQEHGQDSQKGVYVDYALNDYDITEYDQNLNVVDKTYSQRIGLNRGLTLQEAQEQDAAHDTNLEILCPCVFRRRKRKIRFQKDGTVWEIGTDAKVRPVKKESDVVKGNQNLNLPNLLRHDSDIASRHKIDVSESHHGIGLYCPKCGNSIYSDHIIKSKCTCEKKT